MQPRMHYLQFTEDGLIDWARKDFIALQGNGGDPDELLGNIHMLLERTGRSAAALDPEGKSSAEEMENKLAAAGKAAYISAARETLERLKGGDMEPAPALERITHCLSSAGARLSALDAGGQCSDVQMRDELDRLKAQYPVLQARKHMDRMREGKEFADNALESIRALLTQAHADESALDPSGQKTAQDMRRELTALASGNRLRRAAGLLNQVGEGLTAPEEAGQRIDDILRREGKLTANGRPDYGALDPTGVQGDETMRAQLSKSGRLYHVRAAQKIYEQLSHWQTDGNEAKVNIAHHLKEAGADESALATKGESAAAMRAGIDQAVRNYYVAQASTAWSGMSQGGIYPAQALQTIREALKNIPAGYEALGDPGQSAASVEQDLKDTARTQYVKWARKYLGQIRSGEAAPDEAAARIRECLRESGHDAGALDETGQTPAATLEKELQQYERRHRPVAPPPAQHPEDIGRAPDPAMQRALAQFRATDADFVPERQLGGPAKPSAQSGKSVA